MTSVIEKSHTESVEFLKNGPRTVRTSAAFCLQSDMLKPDDIKELMNNKNLEFEKKKFAYVAATSFGAMATRLYGSSYCWVTGEFKTLCCP